MRLLDWIVLAASLLFIVLYGMYKGRGSNTVKRYLLADRTMPWYAMALSIMATQASAITFISTTGQAYVDGMRFVQFYFGLPLAMVIISATAVPLFHRSGVYTAYEYLEKRFDAKTRALASVIFLIQRGLAVGLALYAPAIVLAVLFGWPDRVTTLIMGVLVILYTVAGGIQAVTWTDVQQMLIIFLGLIIALVTVIALLPAGVGLGGALYLAGQMGRLNAVDFSFDWNNRYNVWSGLIGGMFLSLAYFGCDQSQVQRYLTGKSIAQSRLSLLFNAVAKLPMQFFILFIGAMVFVLHVFEQPPMLFQPEARAKFAVMGQASEIKGKFDQAFERRKDAAEALLAARAEADSRKTEALRGEYRAAQRDLDTARHQGGSLVEKGYNDTNYVFLGFVIERMPAGVVGLVIAAIFAAAMSTISAEINSLATVTVIDVYQRHVRRDASDRHYLLASRWATALWGAYAVLFAEYGRNLGSLIEAVNMVGSLFYGSLLGVFALAFFFPKVTGTGAFWGILAGEAAIFSAQAAGVSFLWFNVIGCGATVAVGLAISRFGSPRQPHRTA